MIVPKNKIFLKIVESDLKTNGVCVYLYPN